MLHPSYTELMSVVNQGTDEGKEVVRSRYSIVMGTAKRARQLVDSGYMEQEDHSVKPLSIAVDELNRGRIRILTDEENERMLAEKAEKEQNASDGEASEEETEAAAEEAEASVEE